MAPFRLFRPILAGAQWRDRVVAAVGAVAGIALTMAICAAAPVAHADLPIIVAPLGASAVLAFAVPASPLAQPWSVVGGNIVSALLGAAAYRLWGATPWAAGVAVGGAILLMSLLRCLHPPGGAAALTAVIGGPDIHAAGYAFSLVPVGINSVALVLLAMLFHRLSGHAYPHRAVAPPPAPLLAKDIDAALEEAGESFDIAREDLALLLQRAEEHAMRRRATR